MYKYVSRREHYQMRSTGPFGPLMKSWCLNMLVCVYIYELIPFNFQGAFCVVNKHNNHAFVSWNSSFS